MSFRIGDRDPKRTGLVRESVVEGNLMKGSRQERHALEAAVLWCLPQMAEYTQGRSILQALFVRHC